LPGALHSERKLLRINQELRFLYFPNTWSGALGVRHATRRVAAKKLSKFDPKTFLSTINGVIADRAR
jgi:hypothetical protein